MKEQVSQTKKGNVFRASMYVAVLIGLAGFLIFSILAAITFGNADLSLKDVYSVIVYKLFHIKSLSAYAEGAIHDVVWLIRLPRVLLALAVGMALSVCGVVMQAIVQNPLADPYWKLSWRKFCRSYCFYWRNDYLLCSYCYCKYGRKGNIS